MTPGPTNSIPPSRARLLPLYAAGFVAAFGSFGTAASLAGYLQFQHANLLALGVLLATYSVAEILFKPVFGALADRIGARPVVIGGLVVFAVASAAFVVAHNLELVGLARFGQGIAAAAFSPTAGAVIARLTPTAPRAFDSYCAWKALGYTLGPLVGGVLITVGGYSSLFTTLAVLAIAVAGWVALVMPAVDMPPRTRLTVVDFARRLSSGWFLRPAAALAGASAALAVGVGFLPVLGARDGLGPLSTGLIVSVFAATVTTVQPRVVRARESWRLADHTGMAIGLIVAASGIAVAAMLPGTGALVCAAVITAIGIALITPLGFAYLTRTSPPDLAGQTTGAAEIGRELGYAGGPLLIGGVSAVAPLHIGLLAMTVLLAAFANLLALARPGPVDRPNGGLDS